MTKIMPVHVKLNNTQTKVKVKAEDWPSGQIVPSSYKLLLEDDEGIRTVMYISRDVIEQLMDTKLRFL